LSQNCRTAFKHFDGYCEIHWQSGDSIFVKINAELIIRLRNEKSWSQDELATAAGINIRAIQRVEKELSASLQTKKGLASALGIDIRDLDFEENLVNKCPICKSSDISIQRIFSIQRLWRGASTQGGHRHQHVGALVDNRNQHAAVVPQGATYHEGIQHLV